MAKGFRHNSHNLFSAIPSGSIIALQFLYPLELDKEDYQI